MKYEFWIPLLISILALFWNLYQQKLIEKLKKENNKEMLIHQIQFEKEFSIYNDLWAKLIELRNATAALRPILDSYDKDESEKERMEKRLKRLTDTFYPVASLYEKNKPFYSDKIYEEIQNTIKLTRKEAAEYQYDNRHSKEYWENSEKNINKILESIDKICNLIRARIGFTRLD